MRTLRGALDVARVAAAEVAARRVFDRSVLPNSLHVQVGAAAVAGAVAWAVALSLDLSAPRAPGAVLAVGCLVHVVFFARWSRAFRDGSVRTLRELAGIVGWRQPV